MVKVMLEIVTFAESRLDLSKFPRLPDGVLWGRTEALVLVVVVTAAKKSSGMKVALGMRPLSHLIVRLWIWE